MKATLGELMGSSGEKEHLGLDDLQELLGEKMPDLPMNRIGMHRLVSALQQRFGPGYSSIPMVSGIIKEFRDKMMDENVIRMNKKNRG